MTFSGLDRIHFLLVSFTILLLAGGCSSSPPMHFYTLNSVITAKTNAEPVDASHSISIGVGPVSIPEILDRPQIVIRTGPNELQIDEFHRWAGRLNQNFARVLAENISRLLGTEQVVVYPWDTSYKPQYQVKMDILYFEGRWGQDVLLEVLWTIVEPQGETPLRIKKSIIRQALPDKDYDSLVSAKSRAVAELGEKIVEEIRKLQTN